LVSQLDFHRGIKHFLVSFQTRKKVRINFLWGNMRINNSIRNIIGIMLLLSLARRLPPLFRIPLAFLNIVSKDYPDGTIRITTIKTGLNDLSSGAIYDSLTAQQICPNPTIHPLLWASRILYLTLLQTHPHLPLSAASQVRLPLMTMASGVPAWAALLKQAM